MENKQTDRAKLTTAEIAAAEGAMAEKVAQEKADAQTKADKVKPKTAVEMLAKKYHKSYPNCKTFYITSDMQVFLNDSFNMALLHQKSLKSGELETVKF